MPQEKREFATLRFTGPRFDDHGLDIDVLPELISYKRLLIETAKEIWRGRNPERQRLPRGFEASVVIKFFRLLPGSTEVPLVREVEIDSAPCLPLPDDETDETDEIDEAAETLDRAIEAAALGQTAPAPLPRNVIPLFREFGQTLRPDEAIVIRTGRRGNAARYDDRVRKRLLLWGEQLDEHTIERSGELRSTDALRPVWEVVAEIGAAVPSDDWARVPKDLAENLDHYRYGKPKAAS